jgi:hypothetical protein
MQHVVVYKEQGRFAAWPANYGIWSWGREIVVGFTVGAHKTNPGFHAIDRSKPVQTMQARSLDGGLSWQVGPTPACVGGRKMLSADEHQVDALKLAKQVDELPPHPGSADFTHPGFALLCARTGLRAGAVSWFYTSIDRCHTWDGPYALPMFDQTGIAARTDYLITDSRTCTLFLTAAKPDGEEGRVFCARTRDGGRNFDFLSWVGPEPEGYTIMPASLRLDGSRVLCALRCREKRREDDRARCWIDLYLSEDDGLVWAWRATPVVDTGKGGNPPTLTRLHDGRICLVYGHRDPPTGIRAVISSDEGRSWSDPVILRGDGGDHDLGYPRTILRPDGTLVSVYYFNDSPDGERYIAATLWKP